MLQKFMKGMHYCKWRAAISWKDVIQDFINESNTDVLDDNVRKLIRSIYYSPIREGNVINSVM
jgi:hypothetical protein